MQDNYDNIYIKLAPPKVQDKIQTNTNKKEKYIRKKKKGTKEKKKSRTDIVTGMVIDTKSESFAATLDQSCETGEQFHVIRRKVPETFKEQKGHEGSANNLIQWSLRGVKYVL